MAPLLYSRSAWYISIYEIAHPSDRPALNSIFHLFFVSNPHHSKKMTDGAYRRETASEKMRSIFLMGLCYLVSPQRWLRFFTIRPKAEDQLWLKIDSSELQNLSLSMSFDLHQIFTNLFNSYESQKLGSLITFYLFSCPHCLPICK